MFDCTECQKNPKLRKAWGCEEEMQLPEGEIVDERGNIKYDFRNCPRKFIPDSIIQFWVIYDFQKEHPSSPVPELSKYSGKLLLAERVYKNEFNKYMHR